MYKGILWKDTSQRRERTQGSRPPVPILECTVNKNVKTMAEIIGEQMDERQTEAWNFTLPISATISNGFLQVVNVSTEALKHHEDSQLTTTRL